MKALFSLILLTSLSAVHAEETTPPPPCSTADHKAFDFWQGEWEVHNADGTAAGVNSIKKTQNNCVLKEQWTSAKGGFTGTSLNFYNTQKQQWQQLWLDNSGGSLELTGSRIGNQMIMRTEEAIDNEGNGYFHRITWTSNEDGSVRQLWETIKGEEITIAFDGIYRLK